MHSGGKGALKNRLVYAVPRLRLLSWKEFLYLSQIINILGMKLNLPSDTDPYPGA